MSNATNKVPTGDNNCIVTIMHVETLLTVPPKTVQHPLAVNVDAIIQLNRAVLPKEQYFVRFSASQVLPDAKMQLSELSELQVQVSNILQNLATFDTV